MLTTFQQTMDDAPIARLQWAVAAMMMAVLFLEGIGFQIAAYCGTLLMAHWHLSKPQLAPLLAAAMVGMAVGTLIGSWAGDRYGRKPTLVACVIFSGVMTVICASVSSPTQFTIYRFLSGLGFGAAFPVVLTLASEWMPRRAAAKAIGIITIGIPAGVIIGALLGSWLLPSIGWRYFFVCVGAFCVLFSTILLWALPESPSYLILKGRHEDAHSLLARIKIVPITSDTEAFQLQAAAESEGTLFGRNNARVNFGLWIAYFCTSLANYTIAAWLTVILVEMHLPLATALRGPMAFGSAAIVGALAIGWLMARLGSRFTMLLLACFTIAGGIGISAVISILPPGASLFIGIFAGLIIVGFCMGALQPAFYVLAASVYPTQVRTTGIGIVSVIGRVGAILSSFVGGAVLAFAHQSGFFVLIAAFALVIAGGVLIVDRHIPRLGARAKRNVAIFSPVK